jgi:hypothetical protein
LGLFYALPYLFSLLVYSFPFFLVYLLVFASKRRRPERERLTAEQVTAAIRVLQSSKLALSKQILEIKDQGVKEGLRWLPDRDRFEMRSRRGQQLNQSLEYARSQLYEVVYQLDLADQPESRRSVAWQQADASWKKGQRFRNAFFGATAGFSVTAILVACGYVHAGNFLVWNPFPEVIGAGIEFGSLAGWGVGMLTLSISRRLNQKKPRDTGSCDDESILFDPDAREEVTVDEIAIIDDPYGVLGIPREASIESVKDAYRTAIKKCHPDTVADRSIAIRAAAEAEARRINTAYEAIQKERGLN